METLAQMNGRTGGRMDGRAVNQCDNGGESTIYKVKHVYSTHPFQIDTSPQTTIACE